MLNIWPQFFGCSFFVGVGGKNHLERPCSRPKNLRPFSKKIRCFSLQKNQELVGCSTLTFFAHFARHLVRNIVFFAIAHLSSSRLFCSLPKKPAKKRRPHKELPPRHLLGPPPGGVWGSPVEFQFRVWATDSDFGKARNGFRESLDRFLSLKKKHMDHLLYCEPGFWQVSSSPV